MPSTYTIIETQPTVYLDQSNRVVNGVLVRFRIDDHDELHEVRVPKLDVAVIKSAIEEIVKARDELAALGQAVTGKK